MHDPKKKDKTATKRAPRGETSATLIGETSPLPKRFFTSAQERIAMLWLENDPKKPIRRNPERK